MNESKIVRRDIINLTCEFLETWLHQILYQRSVYPRSIFETQKKFQIPIHIARHPGVQTYISNFIQTCYPLIEKGDIKFISLTIIENEEPVEKFVFEINSYLKNSDIPLDLMLESESILTLADLEQHLRACLIKINTCKPRRTKPEEITFTLSIEKNGDGYPEKSAKVNESIDWMPAEITYNWKQITPLKSVPMDLFRFNTFIMESSKKGKERCP